jgi:hypothetical protein
VGRAAIVTRADVLKLYPGAPEGFVPTHRVEVTHPYSRALLRCDLVRLGELNVDIAYARDAHGEEVYGVLTTGLWQCFKIHGRIRVRPVRYREEYIEPLDREGSVYFVESGDGGPIKIGWTQDVERRIAELQTANAHPLRLIGQVPGTMRDETAMHARFGHLRMEAEWFRNSPEIHEFLRDAVKPL